MLQPPLIVGVVNCVSFNDEATVILSGSIDGTVKCWDTRVRGDKTIQVLTNNILSPTNLFFWGG